MPVIGLTGGVASGKSFVAKCLSDLGGKRIDADALAHEVLRLPHVVRQIVDHWGSSILDHQGQIVRKELGVKVFADEEQLNLLESITHPEIGKMIRSELAKYQTDSQSHVVVLDVPLLFEGEWDKECDHVIYVDTDLKTRQQRAKARGWSDDELQKRESQQLATEEKQRRASFIVDNSGTKAETAEQLCQYWESLGFAVPEQFRKLHFDDNQHE
jgi:dephospho-CoA kinase